MVAGITGVSDKIRQINADAVKNKDIPKTAIKHLEEEKPKPVGDPEGRGQSIDISV